MELGRAAGVLLHPTSLPSADGIGDLGEAARRYLERLAAAGVGYWQVLPLEAPGGGNSPYAGRSTMAGNEFLIDLAQLRADGLLDAKDFAARPNFPATHVDFAAVIPYKRALLTRAWERFQTDASAAQRSAFEAFGEREAAWLEEEATYAALKEAHGGQAWIDWEQPYAARERNALARWKQAHRDEVRREAFFQWIFRRQWIELRRHAATLGIRLIGDVPIFTAYDSAAVWSRRELFLLDAAGRPTVVAGVPPDYFSEDGQWWGNPLYDWSRHEREGFAWWLARLEHSFAMADIVRLDHFRGFAANWEIPAQETTARGGRWVPGPGRKLFEAAHARFGALPLIAEDLGEITPDVIALRDGLGLPGMAILQFGFAPFPRSGFVPYRHRPHSVVYTGTHDNNTSRGWWEDDATAGERAYLAEYLGMTEAELDRDVSWSLIRLALSSVAALAIIPQQDLHDLGSAARMNMPGREAHNWEWRVTEAQLDEPSWVERLSALTATFGRRELEPPVPEEVEESSLGTLAD